MEIITNVYRALPWWQRLSFWYTRLCAILLHRGQLYGTYPYQYHLDRVVGVAVRFGVTDLPFLKSCLGHDLPEDQKTPVWLLRLIGMGKQARTLIFAVTDEPGATRAERKEKTYPKIASTLRAVVLKLCDRIANVEECIGSGNWSQLAKYRAEQAHFRQMCFRLCDREARPLWAHLDKLFADNPTRVARTA
ncbi:MAG: hypothetical protein IT342_24085 [Candidatus Melainabacteria bacterium]|nr:hypothetical protein [Candidatus Melainabacteria bacterium]